MAIKCFVLLENIGVMAYCMSQLTCCRWSDWGVAVLGEVCILISEFQVERIVFHDVHGPHLIS